MPLSAPRGEVLREALKSRHDEPFEKALGRAIRRLQGAYADYVELIGIVRERARSTKVDLRTAARDLRDQS